MPANLAPAGRCSSRITRARPATAPPTTKTTPRQAKNRLRPPGPWHRRRGAARRRRGARPAEPGPRRDDLHGAARPAALLRRDPRRRAARRRRRRLAAEAGPGAVLRALRVGADGRGRAARRAATRTSSSWTRSRRPCPSSGGVRRPGRLLLLPGQAALREPTKPAHAPLPRAAGLGRGDVHRPRGRCARLCGNQPVGCTGC